MGDFNTILSNLRLRRLGDRNFLSDEGMAPIPLPAIEDNLEDADYLQEGPAMTSYQEHLRNPPDPSTMGVGPVKGILAALAGGLTGFGENSAVAGATVGRGIIDAPYRNAINQYNVKAKTLGNLADDELKRFEHRRLFRQNQLDRKERQRRTDIEAMEAEARLNASKNKPPRQLKPEIEYDELGYATGRVWDPDEMRMIDKPELKGFRRSSESPTITQKKINYDQAISRAKEATTLWAELKKELNLPVIGNPHVGPGQGMISEFLTATGAVNNPKVRNLHAIVREMANMELYALSGAQINNKEYERLRRTLADTNKSESQFETDLARFLKYHEAAKAGLISENDVDWTPETSSLSSPSETVPKANRKFQRLGRMSQ